MADYYTHCSFVVPCTAEQAAQFLAAMDAYNERAEYLFDRGLSHGTPDDDPPQEVTNPIAKAALDGKADDEVRPIEIRAEFRADDNCLWLSDDAGCPDLEALADLLHEWIKVAGLQPVGFEWANTCSKPRLDGFGGGAAWISADGVEWYSGSQWLSEQAHGGKL